MSWLLCEGCGDAMNAKGNPDLWREDADKWLCDSCYLPYEVETYERLVADAEPTGKGNV
jgi:hypothetical protein